MGSEALVENYEIIRKELESWNSQLKTKKELIIFSKIDICDPEMLEEMQQYFEKKT
jgi:GTPase involved in cell partitioning and DNA repair